MQQPENFVLAKDGQRLSKQTFESKQAAEEAAKKLNVAKVGESNASKQSIVEAKQNIFG